MKKLYSLTIITLLLLFAINTSYAQSCTTAVTPTIVSVTDASFNTGVEGDVQVIFDINCGARQGDADGTNDCSNGDANSVIWYIGFYGHTSPAPNGLTYEYASGFIQDCDPSDQANLMGDILGNGGDYNGSCLDVKASSCENFEIFQNIGGDYFTWSVADICADPDGFGIDIDTDLPPGPGRLAFTFNLCTGIEYDVYMWEMIVSTPPNTASSQTPSSGSLNPGAFSSDVACGVLSLIDESPVSAVATVSASGTINQIDNPTLVVSNLSVCAGGNGNYTNVHQIEPDVTSAGACTNISTDAETQLNTGADGTGDGTFISDGGDVLPGSDLAASLAVTSGGGGPNPSENGLLDLGTNVIEVNCREEAIINFTTPEGCKGTFSIEEAGTPLCDPTITTSTNALVYLTANTVPIAPNVPNQYPTCVQNGDAVPPGFGTNTCPSDYGLPNGGNSNQNGTGYASAYPSGWTAQFANFNSEDENGNGCKTNLSGNPFSGGGSDPFSFPGVETFDYGDGVMRSVSTICARYEDPCNGTKSVSCVKFISDASPMSATASSTDVTCASANDGQLFITGLIGGSSDPMLAGTATNYVFTPDLGFTQTSSGNWETSNNIAPGTYNVTVSDPLAAGCGSACDIELTFVVREKLPATIVGNVVVCPDQCNAVTAMIQENPIVNYDVTTEFDPNTLNPADCPQTDWDISTVFMNTTSPVAPSGGTCTTTIGNGPTDASLVDICFEIEPAPGQLWDDLFISLDNGSATAGFGQENLFIGTNWTTGGINGVESGSGTITFCTSSPVGTTYDGTLDGLSVGGTVGALFTGADINSFALFIGQRTLGGGPCPGATLVSSSITITDRCVEPQAATLCNLAGMDALTWTPQAGSPTTTTSGDPGLFIDPTDPTMQTAEFCAGAGGTAIAPGDYVYDVSGFHTSGAICCPATGSVTVTVLDAPVPTITGIANGDEFCASDAAVDLTITPTPSPTPGSISFQNVDRSLSNGFPTEELWAVYPDDGTGNPDFTSPIVANQGSADIAANNICSAFDAGASGYTDGAIASDLAPGTYFVFIADSWGDGFNDVFFEIVDQCGNILLTQDDVENGDQCSAGATVIVGTPSLSVSGAGIVQTANPDGIADNGDETYEFDPSQANTATASMCNENTVMVTLVTECGCVIEEEIAVSVYSDPVATDPPALVEADCDAATANITYALADLQNGADGTASTADDLTGGSGSYLMSYTAVDDAGNPITVTNQPLAEITFSAENTTSPVVVTITNTGFTGSYVDSDGVTQMCDGNGCTTTLSLAFEACTAALCPTIGGLTGASTFCADDTDGTLDATGLANILMTDNGETDFGIDFVYFTTQQTGTGMYDNAPDGTLATVAGPLGTSTTPQAVTYPTTPGTYYVYAILNPTPTLDPLCRPFQEIVITINPLPMVMLNDPADVCEGGDNFMFTGSPLPAPDIDDGSFSTTAPGGLTDNTDGTATLDLSVAGPGTYDVTYTLLQASTGCTNSFTVSVTIFPDPVVAFTAPENACESIGLISLTGGTPAQGTVAGDMGVYSGPNVIDNGDGTYDFDAATAGAGNYTLTYTYTDANGCTGMASDDITIFESPTVGFTALPDQCLDAPVSGIVGGGTPPQGTVAGDMGIYSGPGVTDDGGFTYTFDPATAGVGVHTITYTYNPPTGCSGVAMDDIEIFALPTVTLTVPTSLCSDAALVPLTGGMPTGGVYFGTGVVDNGDGTFDFDPATAGNGTHTITYTFTDANSCTNSAMDDIVVDDLPNVMFTAPNDICLSSGALSNQAGGTPAQGTLAGDTGEYSGTGVTYNGDGTFDFDPTVAGIGVHTITYTYTDSGGCTASAMDDIEVFNEPTVGFVAPNDVCIDAGLVVLNSGTPTGGTYSGTGVIDNGDGTFDFDPATGTGVVTIMYNFSDGNGCSGSAMDDIEVFALPTVTLTMPAPLCVDAGLAALTGGMPTGGTYSGTGVIDNGDGTFDFAPATAGSGTHTITYAFTDINGCTASANEDITVTALPIVSFTAPTDFCLTTGLLQNQSGGSPAQGTMVGDNGTYTGPGVTDNGDGTYDFDPSTAGIGVHTIVYTYTDPNGCMDSASDDVEVFDGPTIAFVAPNDICIDAGLIALNTATPTGGTYSGTGIIDNGDGTFDFDPTTAGIGTHTISYDFSDANGCAGTAMDDIEVFALPVVALITPTSLCLDAGLTALTGGTPAGGTYSGTGVIDNGDGTYDFNPITAGLGSTILTYNFTNTNGCSNSATASIEVIDLPNVVLAVPGPLCLDAGLTPLTGGTPSGGAYSGTGVIDNGDGTFDFDPVATGVGSHPISYSFTDASSCSSSTSNNIVVGESPMVSITISDPALCQGEPTAQLFTAVSGGTPPYTLSWSGDTAPLSSTSDPNPLFNTSIAGTFNLTYTAIDAQGCIGSDIVTITVEIDQTPIIDPIANLCETGDPVILNANPLGGTFNGNGVVDNGDGTYSFDPTVSGFGVHIIDYFYISPSGCISFSQEAATVEQAPTVIAGPDQSICANGSVDLASINTEIDVPTIPMFAPFTGSWSTSGDGTFSPDNTFANATNYIPGANDIANGTVTITLTSDDPPGACGPVSDALTISIRQINCGNFPWNE